jgi:hypothetical protein
MAEVTLRDRERAFKRFQALQKPRQQGWDPHWRSIATNLLPRHSRFLAERKDRGGDMNQAIIDSAGTRALRVLTAGMMAGMTSPARPWFRLGLPDEKLGEQHAVRVWLNDVSNLLLQIFRKSNTYMSLHSMYRELGGFGTGLSILRPNFRNVIHHNPMTVGEYALGVNDEGFVDKLGREFILTVEQAMQWFGRDAVSQSARTAYDNGQYEYEVKIMHILEPNPDRVPGDRSPKGMAFKSCYWDKREEGLKRGLLSEGGFRHFPGLAPRWDLLWGDTYGFSPGMEALGDLLQLQFNQSRKAKAIDYQTDPPLQVPTSLRSQNADFLPGGVSYYDAMQPQGGIRTAFEVQLDVNMLLEDIQDVRTRIDAAFYVDMFLMLAQTDKNMTATEVAERHEEKLLMLGPVLERLHNELLEPLVTFTFQQCMMAGILPPVPEELDGVEMQIEFISTLAQAQKAVSVNSVDRLIGHIGLLVQATGDPSPMDKFNADLSIERYADQLGVDPDLIVAGKDVAIVRQQRAEAQQAAMAAEQADKMAGAMGKLGTVQTGPAANENAASDLLGLFSGYQTPSAVEV